MWSNNDGMDPNWRPYFPDSVSIDKKELEALREVVEAARILVKLNDLKNNWQVKGLDEALLKLDEARRG